MNTLLPVRQSLAVVALAYLSWWQVGNLWVQDDRARAFGAEDVTSGVESSAPSRTSAPLPRTVHRVAIERGGLVLEPGGLGWRLAQRRRSRVEKFVIAARVDDDMIICAAGPRQAIRPGGASFEPRELQSALPTTAATTLVKSHG